MVKDSQPKVSIGLPVYNGEDYLADALKSILRQSFTDFELIICDNASSDRTVNICKTYAARDRRIIVLTSDTNRGAAWNYNRAFYQARGEYFKWAAHDDVLAPHFLAKCVESLSTEPGAVLAYPKTTIIDSNGRPIRVYQDLLDLRSNLGVERFRSVLFCPQRESNAIFGLIRTETLKATRLIGNYQSSDRVLLAELALRGKFVEIPEYLFFRRDHAKTSLRANPKTRDIVSWFDPTRQCVLCSKKLRFLGEYLHLTRRVPMNRIAQLQCCGVIAKFVASRFYAIPHRTWVGFRRRLYREGRGATTFTPRGAGCEGSDHANAYPAPQVIRATPVNGKTREL